MKVSCTQENLQRGLNMVSHLASKNVNLPILNNILIKAQEGGVLLASTNLEIGIRCQVRGKIEEPGDFTVPANIFSNYIGLLNSERVDLTVAGTELKVETERQKSKIKGESAAEYPILPEMDKVKEYTVKTTEFKEGLQQVAFAASLDDTRPEISGILFNFKDGDLTLAATDSYRLAEKKIASVGKGGEQQIIVPQKSILELLRILSLISEEEIKIYVNDNQVLFQAQEVELLSRLIEGNYPEYQQILPANFKSSLVVDKEELLKAVKSASLFSKSGINDVNLKLDSRAQEMIFTTANSQLGENEVHLAAEIKGDDNDIVFNYHYLIEGVNNLAGAEVVMELVDGSNPALFREKEAAGKYLYIIMPIKQ